ncbi:MAG TPA: hypothetical protein VHQ86_02990 [Candidatus Saccharimonadia bacterium]|jgi:uncharacterized membrane protein HdeD (DUF308 family)|nr:hypothetical protein [Candidatus Saccharimonadia bacterium]
MYVVLGVIGIVLGIRSQHKVGRWLCIIGGAIFIVWQFVPQ